MAFLNRYGSQWGTLPQRSGRVFWVAPAATYSAGGQSYVASDVNDGESPERAMLTLDAAINRCTANANDTIVLLPGAHSWATSAALDTAGICITGLQSGNFIRPFTSITISTTDQIINVTAADCEIAYLQVIPITAATAIDWTTAAHRLYVHDCSFDLATPAANAATVGIGHVGTTGYTQAPTRVLIQHNYFEVTGVQGPCIKLGDAADFIVERNVVASKGGTYPFAFEQGGVLGWGCFRDNDFQCYKNGVVTAGILGTELTSTLSVAIYRNFFAGTFTKPVGTYGVTDASVAENYCTGSVAGTSAVLWSSAT